MGEVSSIQNKIIVSEAARLIGVAARHMRGAGFKIFRCYCCDQRRLGRREL